MIKAALKIGHAHYAAGVGVLHLLMAVLLNDPTPNSHGTLAAHCLKVLLSSVPGAWPFPYRPP